MTLDIARQGLKACHAGQSPMRYGFVHPGGTSFHQNGGGCYAGVTNILQDKNPFAFSAFHGDGIPMTFDHLVNAKEAEKAKALFTKDWNKFEGTERSLRWVKFLLSEDSPWKALVPFMADQDPEYINTQGFIWDKPGTIPTKLFYNFMMAERFPWELPAQFATWLALCDKGVHPARALYIANCFTLKQGAKSLAGPWEIEYPWSFLEGVSFESCYRFINAKPGALTPKDMASPNVYPLWSITGNVPVSPFEEKTDEIAAVENLMLPDIHTVIDWACEKQEAML